MLLLIDNYDSFTYNLEHYLGDMSYDVHVVRNDVVTIEDIRAQAPSHIILSPGPCTPSQAGLSDRIIKTFSGEIPILGVCLGHQSIAAAFGGQVIKAPQPMHGKTSIVEHAGQGVFAGLADSFHAMRYHSLIVDRASLPDCFDITAWTNEPDGQQIVMGMQHREHAICGVQFHPESILTEHGKVLLRNFLAG
jgi:anthranilate synthase component II